VAKRYKATENIDDILNLVEAYETLLIERDARAARVGLSKLPASAE
jgi:hypothetical protein